jgi:hypothetical protein
VGKTTYREWERSFFLCWDQNDTPSMKARQIIPMGPAMSMASSHVPKDPLGMSQGFPENA